MWSRIKGQLRTREEKDVDENDTILSRALLRYYAPEVPPWLAASVPVGADLDATRSQEPVRTAPVARVFERTESFSTRTVASATGAFKATARTSASIVAKPAAIVTKPTSGLASRLKNTHW